MTCAPEAATFRLLDPYVGWDPDPAAVAGLVGFTDPGGLRLARAGADPDALDRQQLLPWFPDPRLAPLLCLTPVWYLLSGTTVLRYDTCGTGWSPLWPVGCAPAPLEAPAAVAAAGHWLAVAERTGVRVWYREGEQLVAVLPEPAARIVALTPGGYAYVARQSGTDLWRYRAGGEPDGVLHTGLPGRIEGLRVAPDHTLWLLTSDGDGYFLWHSTMDSTEPAAATPAQLAAALPGSALTATWDGGFCLTCGGSDPCCFAWDGTPVPGPPPAATGLVSDGTLRTLAIDSGIPRCRWDRVSVEADVPAGTGVRVAVAVTEDPPAADGSTVPQPGDWQSGPPGALDFLVDQPPGRYLYLRLELVGDGGATPVVRRIRLDFPRVTSAELLPPAYLTDPAADDFTERFLSLFDTSIAGIDRVIERYPALLSGAGVPDEVLPWLGGLLGIAFEAGWGPDIRRALLAAAPELYRRRGTPWAVQEAVRIVFGVAPTIEENAARRSWLRLGAQGTLGAARLFGRSANRFRLGTSALSSAPLHSDGNPHTDPLRQDAYRFRVVLPPRTAGPVDRVALRRLVQSQAPAHTAGSIGVGGLGWVVGVWSAVGVDTAFVALPAPVLDASGRHETRLGRHSVLAPSRRGQRMGMWVGGRSVVGVQSVAW